MTQPPWFHVRKIFWNLWPWNLEWAALVHLTGRVVYAEGICYRQATLWQEVTLWLF